MLSDKKSTSMPTTYNSKNKKQPVPYSDPPPPPTPIPTPPSQKAPAILENVLSITSLKTTGGEGGGGGDVCLIYLVHCASSPHIHSLNPSRKCFIFHLRQECLYPDTINFLWGGMDLGMDWMVLIDWKEGLAAPTTYFDFSGRRNFCLAHELLKRSQTATLKFKD